MRAGAMACSVKGVGVGVGAGVGAGVRVTEKEREEAECVQAHRRERLSEEWSAESVRQHVLVVVVLAGEAPSVLRLSGCAGSDLILSYLACRLRTASDSVQLSTNPTTP